MAIVLQSELAHGAPHPPRRPWVVGDDGRPDLTKTVAPDDVPSPFAVLGIAARVGIDTAEVALQVRSLIRELHPDRYYLDGPQAVADAQRHTALINDAWRVVRDVERRVQWLLDAQPPSSLVALPPAVTMAVFERNELLDEWLPDSARNTAALAEMQAAVAKERAQLQTELQALALQWDDTTEPIAVAQIVQRLRAIVGHQAYLDNLLARLAGHA